MRKFLTLAACSIVVEEFLEARYRRSESYRKSLGGADRLHDVPTHLQIVNIGSGPGLHAITYEGSGLRGFNFSTAPQNFKYGFRLLRRFQDHIEPDAIVVIVVMSPLSFGDNADYGRPGYSDKFYGILPHEDIDDYSIWRLFSARHALARRAFGKLCGTARNLFSARGSSSTKEEPPVIQCWKREFSLRDLRDPSQAVAHRNAFEEKMSILQEGLDYCKGRGWRPILVIPPLPRETRSFIGKEFLEEFVYANVRRLMEANAGLQLLDYFDDELPKDYFADDVFMNEVGRQEFSARLMGDVLASFGERFPNATEGDAC